MNWMGQIDFENQPVKYESNSKGLLKVDFFYENGRQIGVQDTCVSDPKRDYDGRDIDSTWLKLEAYLLPDNQYKDSFKTIFDGFVLPLGQNDLGDRYCAYEIDIKNHNRSFVWLGTAVNELYNYGEANQFGFYYQVLPRIEFIGSKQQTYKLSNGRPDSSTPIRQVVLDTETFEERVDLSNFSVSYFIEAQ